MLSADNEDSFLHVLQWLRLPELRWACCVSRHWRSVVVEHVRRMEAFSGEELRDSKEAAAPALDRDSIRPTLATLRWAVSHASHATLRQIHVGAALPWGWELPKSFLAGLKALRGLEHLCIQGACIPDGNGGAAASLSGLAGLPALKTVNLSFCEQVDAATVTPLRQALPGVQIRRLPSWYLRGGGQHVCVAHPGITRYGGAWFSIGERHTYTYEGRFVFEPRPHLSAGVVNRCWPLEDEAGLILELQFDDAASALGIAGDEYRPLVRIERCSEEHAQALTSSPPVSASSQSPLADGRAIYFTSAHSTRTLAVPDSTPRSSTDEITVGIWRIDLEESET
jgi:hypothetical protein